MKKRSSVSLSSYKATDPFMVVSPSVNHCNPNYLPKAAPLNTITLGVRVSTCELWLGKAGAHFTVTLKTFPKVVLAISSVASSTTLSCSLPSSHEVTQYYIIIILSYSFVFSLPWLAFPCFASLTSCCKTTFTVVSSLLSCIFALHNVSVLCIAPIYMSLLLNTSQFCKHWLQCISLTTLDWNS